VLVLQAALEPEDSLFCLTLNWATCRLNSHESPSEHRRSSSSSTRNSSSV
jgi:hypothetical protein